MKTRFMRRILAKGLILSSLTAPAAGCAIVVGNEFGSQDPRVTEYEANGVFIKGIRDDGSELAGNVAWTLNDDDTFEGAHVKVFADNGRITLVGRVESVAMHEEMIERARDVRGVDSVVARLTLQVD